MIEFAPPSRLVDTVFVHCSASDRPEHDDVSVMREWHLDKNWSDVGYHYFIQRDGEIQQGRPLLRIPAAQKGHNTGTIAICLHGLREDLFTADQFNSLRDLCASIDDSYMKSIRFRGHCEVAAKSCPVFDYQTVLGLTLNGYRNADGSDPTPTISGKAHSYGTIRIFDRGEPVRNLQRALNFSGAQLQEDGLFGQITKAAVIDYQRANGLTVDGIVGVQTWGSFPRHAFND